MVVAHLRRLGIHVYPYLDDWLLKVSSPQAFMSHLQTMAALLTLLDLSINVPK